MKNRKNKLILSIIFILILIIIGYIIYTLISNKQSQNITFYTVGGNKENGLVISDCKEDQEKGTDYETLKKLKGNQFVWVPVENVVANSYDEANEMVENDKYPLVVKDGDNYKTLIYYFDGNNKEIKLKYSGNIGNLDDGVKILEKDGNLARLEIDENKISLADSIVNISKKVKINDMEVKNTSIDNIVARLYKDYKI